MRIDTCASVEKLEDYYIAKVTNATSGSFKNSLSNLESLVEKAIIRKSKEYDENKYQKEEVMQ